MIALVSGALLFTACNSATGPAGATGPKGDAGPTGPQGTAGSTVQQYDFGTKFSL